MVKQPLRHSHINYEVLLDFLRIRKWISEQGARRDIKFATIEFSSTETICSMVLAILFRVSHGFSCIPWLANSSV